MKGICMYKRACLFLMLTISLFDALKSMDLLLKPSMAGCQPLEILQAIWYEYKPVVYASAAFLIGGLYVYDFFSKRHRIQKLEHDVAGIKINNAATKLLTDLSKIEVRVDEYERRLNCANDDLTYLWEYVLTVEAIHQFNKIENEGKPYIARPRIPQFKNKTIIDLIEGIVSNSIPRERNNYFALRSLPSPRRRSNSPPKSSSPRLDSSDEDELKKKKIPFYEMNGNGKEKKSPRKKGDD